MTEAEAVAELQRLQEAGRNYRPPPVFQPFTLEANAKLNEHLKTANVEPR